ncbi:MAG: hypothetical protein JW795_12030 [Chitinivibrionales bacterium]|nr:hypothetical protein [Chitinivibrionales bacterium]
MGKRFYAAQNTIDVLNRFSTDGALQRQKYRQFIAEGVNKESAIIDKLRHANTERDIAHVTNCRVIGNKEFVSKVLDEQKCDFIPKYAKDGIEVHYIACRVGEILGIQEETLKIRGRQTLSSEARKLVSYTVNG